MISKCIADIVCRSNNTKFREAVLNLMPSVRKRKIGEASDVPMVRKSTEYGVCNKVSHHDGTVDKDDQIIRDGIVALLSAHCKALSQESACIAMPKRHPASLTRS